MLKVYTVNVTELILNAVALGIILDIDDSRLEPAVVEQSMKFGEDRA